MLPIFDLYALPTFCCHTAQHSTPEILSRSSMMWSDIHALVLFAQCVLPYSDPFDFHSDSTDDSNNF